MLKQFSYVLPHLVLPVGPVVAALGPPVVERMADALAGENLGEPVGRAAVLPLARSRADVNVASRKLAEEPRIAQIRKIIDRIVEVEIVIVHSVHEILHVINAGHGEAALDGVGVLEEGVSGVIRAERCAHGGNSDALGLAIVPDEWNDFLAQVGIKHRLDVAAMKRVRALVVKAEAIDGIDGEQLHFSVVDEIRERSDHALAFELPFIARAGGKTEKRRAPVAENDDAELEAHPWGMPAVKFAFHADCLAQF